MLARGEAEWPSDVLAHLAGCDSCAAVAVEFLLQRAPEIRIPPTFAVDVARRARQDAPPEMGHLNGVTVGIGAAGMAAGLAAAWFGVSDRPTVVLPAAALLLACGEAIVLAVWTLHADVTRARWRR